MKLIKKMTTNKWIGGNRMEVIVIHWWDEPHKKPSLSGVVSWLMNPAAQVSAHYVVSGDTVYQLAEENDITWHAREANAFSIGIEIDPNTPGNTYKTAGELVRAIRSRRGGLPLKRHSDYVNTNCPGDIDLSRIDREANNEENQTMVDSHQLNVIFRFRLGRSPDASAKKTYIGKPFNDVDKAVQNSKEYKDKVAEAKKNGHVHSNFLEHNFREALGSVQLVPRGSDASNINIKDLTPGVYRVK